jgi:hypothetical protein
MAAPEVTRINVGELLTRPTHYLRELPGLPSASQRWQRLFQHLVRGDESSTRLDLEYAPVHLVIKILDTLPGDHVFRYIMLPRLDDLARATEAEQLVSILERHARAFNELDRRGFIRTAIKIRDTSYSPQSLKADIERKQAEIAAAAKAKPQPQPKVLKHRPEAEPPSPTVKAVVSRRS